MCGNSRISKRLYEKNYVLNLTIVSLIQSLFIENMSPFPFPRGDINGSLLKGETFKKLRENGLKLEGRKREDKRKIESKRVNHVQNVGGNAKVEYEE